MRKKDKNRGARYQGKQAPDEKGGHSSSSTRDQGSKTSVPSIMVSVVNGHLRYANYPVLVGHFKGDSIVSAERVLDRLLEGKLSERLDAGLYPGGKDTNFVRLPEKEGDPGAVVIGLGEPDHLTSHLLSSAVELGVLAYAFAVRDAKRQSSSKTAGISILLIGSAYGYLSLSNSINAIVDGVISANRQILSRHSGLPVISHLEFIELYRDKALNAFYFLNEMTADQRRGNVRLIRPIRQVEGGRSYMPLFDEQEWWKRITALVETDEVSGAPYFSYTASTGRARADQRKLYVNQTMIEALLAKNSMRDEWDRELTRAIFELLVPNEFKLSFRNQHNILLILDKDTARYPWELLHPEEDGGAPVCVSAGMIRQLATGHDRQAIVPVNNRRVLVIGDPVISDSAFPQLPGARAEAKLVQGQLDGAGYDVVAKIGDASLDIITKLFTEYRVIHIASHGVVDYGPEKKSGILLSGNFVLSPAEIEQISSTPELVFINACYMGRVDPEKEKYYRDKYKTAANIGTQLIENGVKAVVIAGWAVRDEAARLFAEVFYRHLLNGAFFSDAVKAARRACYDAHPDSNTWGAYQCYGDPFYQLEKNSRKTGQSDVYILDKEIFIELEILINDARSSGKKVQDLMAQLRNISDKIDRSGLRNGKVAEMEAIAYAELQDFDTAIDKYQSMFTEEKADFSIRSLEQWCNLRARRLTSWRDEKASEVLSKEMDEVIGHLQNLIQLGPTSERLSLLGSAYKRKSAFFPDEQGKRAAVTAMAESYKEAFVLNNNGLKDIRIYPLSNWIVAEALLEDRQRMAAAETLLGRPLPAFLQYKKKELEQNKNRKDFWDLIAMVNIHQCELLFAHTEHELDASRKEIVSDYQKAWRLGGSKKQKDSEMAHMRFIQETLIGFGQKNTPRLQAIESLIDFFDQIDR